MFNIIKKIRNKIDLRIREYCYHELKKVQVKNLQGMFNLRCHENACQYAKTHKGYQVVMGIFRKRTNQESILHFWVRKDEQDYEITIGYQCEDYNYFEIKVIDEPDYLDIKTIFDEGLNYYKEKLTTLFERLFVRGRIL